ncbi:Vacuolar amino acid transporter 7 [Bienertia sinuspersici]
MPFRSSINNLLVWVETRYFRNPYVRTYKKFFQQNVN